MSRFSEKQITFHIVGGLHPISGRPEEKKTEFPEQEGILSLDGHRS